MNEPLESFDKKTHYLATSFKIQPRYLAQLAYSYRISEIDGLKM
jgi:hypothetical protein